MKAVERILIKTAVIQFLFLLLTQLLFHQMDAFPYLKQIAKYEGVCQNLQTKFVETFLPYHMEK